MPHSRRYFKDLRGVSADSPEYWEEMLRRDGLTMRAGEHKALSYVGNSNDLSDVHEMTLNGTEAPVTTLRTPSQSDT